MLDEVPSIDLRGDLWRSLMSSPGYSSGVLSWADSSGELLRGAAFQLRETGADGTRILAVDGATGEAGIEEIQVTWSTCRK